MAAVGRSGRRELFPRPFPGYDQQNVSLSPEEPVPQTITRGIKPMLDEAKKAIEEIEPRTR